ncbi:MAG: hypothetical protein ABI210_11810 [Abditibacteriaceae bacterium]
MKPKVLYGFVVTCMLLIVSVAGAQQQNIDDTVNVMDNVDNVPNVVVTQGIPDAGVTVPIAPIQEYYGPSSLPSLPTVAQLIAGIAKAEQTNNANDLVYAYGEAVRVPILARGALTRLMYDYYRMRAAATTPEQATQAVNEASLRFQVFQSAQMMTATQQNQQLVDQNTQLIKQNQQIIQLLQQIAKK